jgi:hypothetical protein
MVFLTNNLTWSAQTVADLYRCRWSIEVFFKELKQTLQLLRFRQWGEAGLVYGGLWPAKGKIDRHGLL